ncbi:MAG: helix-turn-helix domain-containing protein, partial [Mycetocola sp.]
GLRTAQGIRWGREGRRMARYLRALEEHGVDVDAVGSISATAKFGAATIAVHTTGEIRWEWQANVGVHDLAALVFLLRGSASVRSIGSVERVVSQRDAYLLHSRRQVEVHWAARSSFLVLALPTDAILGSGIEPAGLPLTFERTPLLAATREFALALSREPGPTARFSTYVSERLLAEMAFGLVLEGREVGRDVPTSSLSDRARTIMLVRRAEPDLTAAAVAADLHVSVRQLQRAFAQSGSSPAAVLRGLRVDLAGSMLRDPQFDGLSVDQVAQYSGFTSTSAMRRAFESEGSTAPSVVRRTRQQVAN